MRILLADDDPLIATSLTQILALQNYAVEIATDGETAWELIESFPFDLALLDVMMPKLDGLELCRRLRSHGYQMPILLLTGRDSSHDKAIGLDAGADDYVSKPFDPEELVARIRALLRRGTVTAQPVLEWNELRLDPSSCEVTYRNSLISLTPKEYGLLELFLRNPRQVFSCGAILEHLWSFEDTPGEEAVRTHMKGLRQKLKGAGAPSDLVETVYGIGYRLTQLKESPKKNQSPAHPAPTPDSIQQQTQTAIAAIWERFKPNVLQQVHVLMQAVTALTQGTLTPELHYQAVSDAHTLAGSLGTFGLPNGSKLARQIEELLQTNPLTSTDSQQLHKLVTALHREVDPQKQGVLRSPPASGQEPATVPKSVKPSQMPVSQLPVAARIMAVDDDPKILEILHTLLEPWGLQVTTLSDPRRFWQTFTAITPDLVILDLNMPHHNGFDLCQALRDSDRWSSIPVMVLAANTDAETLNFVFSVGADDFVSKPIVGPELVTRIINRLERVRLLRHFSNQAIAFTEPSSQASLPAEEFFRLSPNLLCWLNLDGHFLQVNPAFEHLLGYKLEALQKQHFLDLIHPQEQEKIRLQFQQLDADKENAIEFESRYCSQDSSYKWLGWQLTASGKQGHLYAIGRDITERKQQQESWQHARDEIELRVAERTAELVSLNQRLLKELEVAKRLEEERNQTAIALSVSQARFAGILEIADDAIISIDAQQRITLFNQGAEKIFRYTAQEVLGQPLDMLLPIKAIAAHRQHVNEFGHSDSKARRMAERRAIFGRRKDGSEFPAEASISRLALGTEKVFTVILRDITERKNIDRMKDEFVSVVSHELRTPLTSIHGSLGLLASGLIKADSDRGQRLLQIAVENTDRLVRLINDVLDIERIESGNVVMLKQSHNVADLLHQAVESVQAIADKANITLNISSLSIKVYADSDRIIQTLTNLLSNAIKFSNPGQQVWLTVALTSPTRSASTSQTDTVPELCFTVKDQGRGIPSDRLESIFERFQQVDASDSRNHDGTGLGLAICRSIVQQHGGNIWAESILGEGSTFYFTLPLHLPIPETAQPK